MRLELLNGKTYDLEVTPSEPFEEKYDQYKTYSHLTYQCKTSDSNIFELALEHTLEDVQLWDGEQLEFRGNATVTTLSQVLDDFYFTLDASAPFWHKSMK